MPSNASGDKQRQHAFIVLASGSPRRRELLARLLPSFDIQSSPVEEEGSDRTPGWPRPEMPLPPAFAIDPAAHPTLWAWRKAADVVSRLSRDASSLVLGADTIVIAEGRVLGKPSTPEQAADMLRALRGRLHYVATGFVLVRPSADTVASGVTVSGVLMRDYSETELEGYVATSEPLDKAGAYAVQGLGGALVDRVEGCYFNVVGLPLCDVRAALISAGADTLPYPAGGYCDFCPRKLSR